MENAWARRAILTALACFTAVAIPVSSATADWLTDVDKDRIKTLGLDRQAVSALADTVPGSATSRPKPPWYEYASTSYCSKKRPGEPNPSEASCSEEYSACNPIRKAGPPSGPAVNVWRREVDQKGTPLPKAGWESLGWTCLSDMIPGAENVLTMAMLLNEFRATPFAKPTVSIQPVGLKTLVNLPTYYELTFPTTGFRPGEVDSTTLVGRRVDIRPTFRGATYIFGDGHAEGPTEKLGGPYPRGDVRHTYTRKGTVPVQVNVTYGGEFRVDDGDWVTIPDSVVVEGTPSTLAVLEARARLYGSGRGSKMDGWTWE